MEKKNPRKKGTKAGRSHDEYVRNQLSQKENAIDLIRQFLPVEIVEKLDFSRLELDPTAYITEELKEYYSDLVWICAYDQVEIRLAFLLEHKSKPVPYPHLQILRYELEIWERSLKNKEPLLPIIPIILYHGKEKWHQRPMREYFKGVDAHISRYLPDFEYQLIDLSVYTPAEIASFRMGFMKSVLIALLITQTKKALKSGFQLVFSGVESQYASATGENFLRSTLVYLFKNSELSGAEIKSLIETIPPPLKEISMSTYDVLIEQGKEQGIGLGLEQGIELVIRNARAEGFDIKTISKLVMLDENRVKQILEKLGLS